ncbi:hypothetical protein MBLNU457_7644t1 [Dothideomycetes sp. NU457]
MRFTLAATACVLLAAAQAAPIDKREPQIGFLPAEAFLPDVEKDNLVEDVEKDVDQVAKIPHFNNFLSGMGFGGGARLAKRDPQAGVVKDVEKDVNGVRKPFFGSFLAGSGLKRDEAEALTQE